MKLRLTESTKKFIDTLTDADLAKVTLTEDTMESDDPAISEKIEQHLKDRFEAVGAKVRLITELVKAEHPEYF